MPDQLQRIEAKLDALLTKSGILPADVTSAGPPTRQPRILTAAEQQAIDNAPKPSPVVGPQRETRTTETNAPSTAGSTPAVPADAVGSVTVETEQPDGDTTVKTMPASEAKKK